VFTGLLTGTPTIGDAVWGIGNVRRRLLAVAIGIAALGIAGAAVGASLRAEGIAPAPVRESNAEVAQASTPAQARVHKPIPVRISIPSIGVNARIVALGLNRDRTIEVPRNFAETGWFRPGPEPGEQGAAVILGHVNSRSGPAVFSRLRELRVGGMIHVRLQDGSTVKFAARSMLRVPKNRFPTKLVYARTQQPTLRLITCAGPLNYATGHHPDNYIVFATLAR
jgi:sortase (surface protein transpeptidase)